MTSSEGHTPDADVIVVGSGIAGLMTAVTARERGRRVIVVTKASLRESNTLYAQGGIAAALSPVDSPALHASDTVACARGLGEESMIRLLTDEARQCIERLEEVGVRFDQNGDGPALTREAAHAVPRVLHAGGDATGKAIHAGLGAELRREGSVMLEHTMVVRLLCDAHGVNGVRVVSSGRREDGVRGPAVRDLHAREVVLATGGAGRLFSRTTNPAIATADGIALAFKAGAEVMDLEFLQFHPTALAVPESEPFLISEAVRGEGGLLRNLQGRRFMRRYHPDAELAPRDVVARAMWSEMRAAEAKPDHDAATLFLDLTYLQASYLRRRFPTIWTRCARLGVDISRDWIPVSPAAHYFMGGVRTDENGRTTVPGLWAVGEVACTGVHGASRLASNSLLEGLVFGRRAGLTIGSPSGAVGRAGADDHSPNAADNGGAVLLHTEAPHERLPRLSLPQPGMLSLCRPEDRAPLSTPELQRRNWDRLGIVRTGSELRRHLDGLARAEATRGSAPSIDCRSDVEEYTARQERANLLLVSQLMARAAALRTESRGAHYRADFPNTDEAWRGHIVLLHNEIRFLPVSRTYPEREAIPA